jgi:hypothetical protein
LIKNIFTDIQDQLSRSPKGNTINAYPTFRFPNLGAGVSSTPEISKLGLDIQTFDHVKSVWKSYKSFPIKDVKATSLVTPRLLKIGKYRWRLSGATKPSTVTYPDGSKGRSDKGGKFVEETFTEFERLSNAPATITKLTSTSFQASGAKKEVFFEDDPNAEAFAILLKDQFNKSTVKVFKRKLLQTSANSTLKAVLSVKDKVLYDWYIQGLNYDRKKADPNLYN